MPLFLQLSRPTLNNIADALEASRLGLPVSTVSLSEYAPESLLMQTVAELNQLHQKGMIASHIAYLLRLLATERAASQAKEDQVSLVWTGPKVQGTESRDTGIVVRQLFSQAQSSVLISSFAIDQGVKGYELFRPLAQRMDSNSDLEVRMFMNVKRKYRDQTSATVLLRKFAENFRDRVWPGKRLPEVFHDPRAIEMTSDSNACLHAKCVVVDEEQLLITSANFTEAAHERNIEAGVLMSDRALARAIRSQFEMLVTQRILTRIPGL